MAVYLIHFDEKLHHAQHYVGYTENLEGRMFCHRNGNGARILNRCNKLGIKYKVVRIWKHAGPDLEQHIKRHKNTKHYCPVCSRKPRKPRVF